MEMDSIKQMVIQASTTLYSTQDKEQRRTAEEWLNDFKKSLDAWYVADQILHSSRNEHVLFFAAQTIRTKIQSSFHELPLSSHEVILIVTLINSDLQAFILMRATVSQKLAHGTFKQL